MTDEQWQVIQQALFNGEQSHGNYQSYNYDSGAAGAYQFMPETWREKANLYGFSEYADLPNASYAPPYVQDSVARGWADDLLKRYNGDIRYVVSAWLGGEGAADEDYANGYISTTRSDGNITSAEYVDRALSGLEARPTATSLDTNYIVTNNPDQNVTNTERLRPESIYGANMLGAWLYSNYQVPLMITGGAEIGYHAKSASGHGHEDGWKIDVANDEIAGGTEGGVLFKEFCNNQGWSCNWEGDHWDIDFSGTDSRDPQSGGFTGNFFGEAFSSMPDEYGYDYINQMMSAPHDEMENVRVNAVNDVLTPSFWNTVSLAGSAFWLGMTNDTGVGNLAQALWSNIFHSSNHFGAPSDLTAQDIEYVKNTLPDDEEAQRFILLNARDSEEAKYLANQKLKDKQREEAIAKYNDGCTFTIVNAARFMGSMLDPTMLIPVGTAFNSIKIAGRLGKAIYDTSKVAKIAARAAKVGIVNAGVSVVDNALREKYGGYKPDYGWDAAVSGFAGAVLGGLGGLFGRNARRAVTGDIIAKADEVETKAIYHAADMKMPTTDNIRSETINKAKTLHDSEFGKSIKSKLYSKLEGNDRVVAMSYEKARKLVSEASGIDIPKTAKAFYVPNEDYSILITDNIKGDNIDKILAHEFGVHAGLKELIGEKEWTRLTDVIAKQANKPDTIWAQARRMSGAYDPEEILAYAVENKLMSDSFTSRVKGVLNKTFNREGIDLKLTREQVEDLLTKQVDAQRNLKGKIHYNEDGSTAFAGIRFSKDNPLNPQRWADFIELEQNVRTGSQSDMPRWMPKKISQWLEDGILFGNPFGTGINSVSNTLRALTPRLLDDPRGRGRGGIATLTAEQQKERIRRILHKDYIDFMNCRQQYIMNNKKLPTRGAHLAYDKQVIDYYNAMHKVGGNKANVSLDVPEEVRRGAVALMKLREKQIELGKRSAVDMGVQNVDNLIETDWMPVDPEIWRIIDIDKRQQFLNSFNDEMGVEAGEFLSDYMRRAAKRDVIKARIERDIDKQNRKIQEANDKILEGSERQPEPLLNKNVTDKDIDKWLDEHIPNAVKHWINGNYDTTMKTDKVSAVGTLSTLKTRIPLDTTVTVEMPNGKQFSFDNDLRSYDLDSVITRTINRFAGEIAIKNTFGNQKGLETSLSKVKKELDIAVRAGRINKSRADKEYKLLEESIDEIRGFRPREEIMGRFGALTRIMSKLTYAYNGTNMGFAQLGELGGTMAYGGVSQLAHIFKPLGNLIDNTRLGKITNETLHEAQDFMFGAELESQIFTKTWEDKVIRDALTADNIINKTINMAGTASTALSQVTSSLNMLPKMTDSMLRGMRNQTLMDAIRWADGKKFSKLRNPFSPAKLKASRISSAEATIIKDNIKKYTIIKNGDVLKFDVEKWQAENPKSFAQFYCLVDNQAKRAIVSAGQIGNRNNLKNMNHFTRLLFQFKDYSFRAVNAQTMRAMTAGDLDDAVAALSSVVTNTAAYAIKAGATYTALQATGTTDKAQEYYDRMFSDENLIRAAAFRSSIIGSPFSLMNDLGEMSGLGAFANGSIRTTVSRNTYGQPKDASDVAGRVVSQIPSLQTVDSMFSVPSFILDSFTDENNKKDFKKFLEAFPYTKWLPINAVINSIVDNSDYPDK